MLRRRMGVCILAVILLGLMAAQGAAQVLDDSLLDLLKDLPAAEQEKLLREYGLPPSGGDTAPDRDVSTPQVMLPREQLPSEFEAAVARESALEKDEGPVPPPLEVLTGEALEIQRAFENFVAEAVMRFCTSIRTFCCEAA